MRINQDWKDAFTHLRLHFSMLLMPVFLFALSQTESYDPMQALLTFTILHILIYPASNLYNSFNDNDTGSVGGIKNPPPSNRKMLLLANIIDITAVILGLFNNYKLAVFLLMYIVASRLYSNRRIRLKRYPVIGFLVIFIFQGAFTFYISEYGSTHIIENCSGTWKPLVSLKIIAMLATSFQIGAIYPLTQIYQHQSDLTDGVTTLSYKLGYRGTFIFAGIMFGIATLFYYLHFKETDINSFYLFTVVQIPIIGYFVYWARKVWQDTTYADYKHTMYMNVIAAVILNLFFLYLVLT